MAKKPTATRHGRDRHLDDCFGRGDAEARHDCLCSESCRRLCAKVRLEDWNAPRVHRRQGKYRPYTPIPNAIIQSWEPALPDPNPAVKLCYVGLISYAQARRAHAGLRNGQPSSRRPSASRPSASTSTARSLKRATGSSSGCRCARSPRTSSPTTTPSFCSTFLTTTALDIDEELLGRSLVLTVDEGRDQTRAIHNAQRHRQTLDGLLAAADREAILKLHQNAQRLLRPLHVINPFAAELRFADHAPRTRRDHDKYLALIKSVALLHQYQRPIHEVDHRGVRLRYIEVTLGYRPTS